MFLLCAIGLQGLLYKAKYDGSIKGVSICKNGPQVSHLFFVDDSVLFCHVKEAKCQVILDILAIYEKGSRQKLTRIRPTSSLALMLTRMSRFAFNNSLVSFQ